MAYGLAPLSQSFKADMRMIGGLVTGSVGEFLALPISSTVLAGMSGLKTNEWSLNYLSASFINSSASVIHALNFLKAAADAGTGDVTGPGSSTDNAVVRFNGTGGKTIQNSTLVTFSDAGALVGGAGASYTFGANGQISGTNAVIAGTTVSGAGNVAGATITSEESTISIAGVVSGAGAGQFGTLATQESTISLAGVVSGAGAGQFGTLATQEAAITLLGAVSGAAAGIFGSLTTEESTISVAGVVSGAGAGQFASLFIANGFASVSNTGAAVFAGGVGASTVEGGKIQPLQGGSISGTVGGGMVASNTGSLNNANQKVAFAISSSDISTSDDAALIPRMVLQGTNEAGLLSSYMISITGGLLQTVELTYGTALPI